MRRTGLVLAGVGAFLIVFALLQAFWVTGQVTKFPLNQYATVTLTDPNASYFSAAKLTEMSGVNLEATYTIKGNARAGSSSTAVWNQFIYVYDQTNKVPVQTITRTFAFDRRTAQLINCCGANVNGDSSIQQHGYVGYVLPIGTKRQTYDVFDTNLNKAVPFTFTGVGDAGGTQAYKFTVNVPPTQNGTQTVPGSLVHSSAASVTLPQYYEVHSTYWIDPVTGALLNVTQDEKLTLRNNDGSTALVLLSANLAATQASIDGLVAIDNDQLSKASLVGTLLPLMTGVIGLLLLIVGIVLFRRPEEAVEAAPSHREPELAAAGPEAAASRSLVPGLDDEAGEATVQSPVVREAAVNEAEVRQEEAAAADAKAADAKAADAQAADAQAADAQAKAGQAEAKAEDKAAQAGAEPASAAAAGGAAEAKAEAAQAETAAEGAKAEAEAKGEEAQAAEAKATEAPAAAADAKAEAADNPADAATAEIPEAGADTTESPAATDADDATAENPATSRRRRGAHRR